MRIIAFIQDNEPVRAILKHLGIWEDPKRAPPKKAPLPIQQFLFPRRQQVFSYPTRDEDEARTAPALMAAEAWEGYQVDPPASIEYHATPIFA
jgi:hypothetical protein